MNSRARRRRNRFIFRTAMSIYIPCGVLVCCYGLWIVFQQLSF